ncbi:hypothetical protein M408DRAFT_329381 [Serendipita vermifera MAFF 305830]|uniref:Phytanoyl-CoA dioxygenase n=1 Tax=Serendipita vermifera MAFF 305830 TaxID=933852 RepID=A0A0C3BB20_SERVB|nr:hypothetical protein M408DRAFT_329381 [Serendipita vermifera MAFF 305830]
MAIRSLSYPSSPRTTPMAPQSYKVLSPEDVDHFLRHGFVRIPQVLTPEQVSDFTSGLWTRLGYSPTDKTTWTTERINMPSHRSMALQDFAPKAWGAMCDLLGGEDRIDPSSAIWGDSFICNFGSQKWDEMNEKYLAGEDGVDNPNNPKKLDNWHVDGDFFIHFLDSPEQGLLVIPLFSDVVNNGGATMVSPDGIGKLAKWLMDHPQGVLPRMKPVVESSSLDEKGDHGALGWYQSVIQECEDFREMTGNAGDVVLMHPLMLHSASRNLLRTHRIITNPAVSLRSPFNLDREDPSEYSLVEQKTLRELAKIQGDDSLEKGLKGWKIVGERKRLIPERIRIQAEMRRKEEARLRGEMVAEGNEFSKMVMV